MPLSAPPARYAVIGNPVSHSQSPWIHAAFARQTGQDIQYSHLLAPHDGFLDAIYRFFDHGGHGLNVTVPFKQEAFEAARTHLSPRARAAGAVNTLWRDAEGHLHGCNTDGVGLLHDLRRLGAQLDDARILLVGAGGAARGVILPLLEAGCARLCIVNRTPARAADLAAAFGPAAPAGVLAHGGLDTPPPAGGWQIVVNATASSLQAEAPALPAGLYADGALAYDMVYGRAPTPFMRQASADGAARVADGLGMLVAQAAESFFLWRGVRPDATPVLEALRARLAAGD